MGEKIREKIDEKLPKVEKVPPQVKISSWVNLILAASSLPTTS